MYLARVCFTRFGVRRFARDVSALLSKGYSVVGNPPTVKKVGLFRFLCEALLLK